MRGHDGLQKYPRTAHLEGSRLQPGDEDMQSAPFSQLVGRSLVVEEKIDGQNAGISFGTAGELLLQSRGHFLRGGAREASFAPLKGWAQRHRAALHDVLGARYVLFGEWCYAKHTVFYDALPHWFLAFDLYDKEHDLFVDTPTRRRVLAGAPVVEVPVLAMKSFTSLAEMLTLLGPSTCKTPAWRTALRAAAEQVAHLDVERTVTETDDSDEMEGLYVKVEEGGVVVDRLKWVRPSFLQAVFASDSHWFDRPIVPNGLRAGVDLFAGAQP